MKKIHTKVKRKFGLSSNKNQYKFFHPSAKSNRPKTFVSETMAKAWAKLNSLKEGEYTLKLVKHNKRFQIVSIKKA
jgi:hypothetical protein